MVRIVQITDSHMAAEPELVETRRRDLARAVEAANRLSPDLVIHTGDASNTGQPEEYAIVRAEMDRLEAPYVITPGNRDSRQRMREAFGDLGWLPEGDGLLIYAVQAGPVRVISYDSKGPQTNKGWADEERLALLEREIAAAQGGPVMIFMHHPPYELAEIPDPRQYADWAHAEALNALVAKYDNVEVVACGHAHRTIPGRVGKAPAYTLMCNASDLRKGPARALGDTPAVMVYDFTAEGRLKDARFEVFFDFDMAAAPAAE